MSDNEGSLYRHDGPFVYTVIDMHRDREFWCT